VPACSPAPAAHILPAPVVRKILHPMKTLRVMFSLAVAAIAFATYARAADAKPAGTPAKCCEKAAADGKKCDHECCTEAAKAGKNCEKCHGTNTAEKKS
jgi:hypothetical protein